MNSLCKSYFLVLSRLLRILQSLWIRRLRGVAGLVKTGFLGAAKEESSALGGIGKSKGNFRVVVLCESGGGRRRE
jgi:hypothetical protein